MSTHNQNQDGGVDKMTNLKGACDKPLNSNKNFGFFRKSKYFFCGMAFTFIFFYSHFISTIKQNDKELMNEINELKRLIQLKHSRDDEKIKFEEKKENEHLLKIEENLTPNKNE